MIYQVKNISRYMILITMMATVVLSTIACEPTSPSDGIIEDAVLRYLHESSLYVGGTYRNVSAVDVIKVGECYEIADGEVPCCPVRVGINGPYGYEVKEYIMCKNKFGEWEVVF